MGEIMGEKKYVNDLEILTKFEALGYKSIHFEKCVYITRECDPQDDPITAYQIIIDEKNKTYYKIAKIGYQEHHINMPTVITMQEHKILHDYAEYMGWLDE